MKKIVRFEPSINRFLFVQNGELRYIEPNKFDSIRLNIIDKIKLIVNDKHPKNALSSPIRVQIQPSNFCNLDCDFCFANSKNKIHCLSLTKNQIYLILDQLAEMGVLQIEWSGGEPLLYKGLIEILEYAQKLGFEQHILTNGTLFASKLSNLDAIKKYITHVQVSIDGIEGCYNNIVGKNIWHIFDKAVKKIVVSEIPAIFATTIQKKNIGQLSQIIKYCINNNVKKIRFGWQVATGRSSLNSWKEYQRIIIKLNETLPKLENLFQSQIEIYSPLNKIKYDSGVHIFPIDFYVSPGAKSFLYIDCSGESYAFPFLTDPLFKLGNISKNKILDIWYSKQLDLLRNINYNNTDCKGCDYICSLWDRSFAYHYFGDLYASPLKYFPCPKRS